MHDVAYGAYGSFTQYNIRTICLYFTYCLYPGMWQRDRKSLWKQKTISALTTSQSPTNRKYKISETKYSYILSDGFVWFSTKPFWWICTYVYVRLWTLFSHIRYKLYVITINNVYFIVLFRRTTHWYCSIYWKQNNLSFDNNDNIKQNEWWP